MLMVKYNYAVMTRMNQLSANANPTSTSCSGFTGFFTEILPSIFKNLIARIRMNAIYFTLIEKSIYIEQGGT
jgi:hypothetical protein